MAYTYTDISRVLSKVEREIGADAINERDIIEWIGEALEGIGTNKRYEEAVAFIEVNNYQFNVPAGFHNLIQLARNNYWNPTDKFIFSPKAVTQSSDFLLSNADPNCIPHCDTKKPDYIIIDCEGQPINDYDLAYYRPYYDLRAEYYGWSNCNHYKTCYTPVRLANHTFFNSVVCKENDYDKIYQSCQDEYSIIQGKIIRCSFKEGYVALAYNRQIVDPETGYPLVPDNYSHLQAIQAYIDMMLAKRDFSNNREGSQSKYQTFSQNWQWYCKQATNDDMMTNGLDEHQNLLDQRLYMLPRQNRYDGFFGKLSQREDKKFNNPDRRNISYFRGQL